jgi:anti-sigma-K factor RskA
VIDDELDPADISLVAEALPLREPPARLRQRIINAAQVDTETRRRARVIPFVPRLRMPDLRVAALAAAVVLLLGVDASAAMRLRATETERDRYYAALQGLSHGSKQWYMAGVDQWAGSGGNLIAPGKGETAFVLFHDLRDLPAGQVYTLWLISPDGGWARGASFRPTMDVPLVAVGLDVAGFDRCAVTVETSETGKRQGPIVMQSRIAPTQ